MDSKQHETSSDLLTTVNRDTELTKQKVTAPLMAQTRELNSRDARSNGDMKSPNLHHTMNLAGTTKEKDFLTYTTPATKPSGITSVLNTL